MARLTQRLEILRVVEFDFITTMRLDVVHDSGGGDAPLFRAKLAQRLFLQLVVTQAIPSLRSIKMLISRGRHDYRANWPYIRRDFSGVVTMILLWFCRSISHGQSILNAARISTASPSSWKTRYAIPFCSIVARM